MPPKTVTKYSLQAFEAFQEKLEFILTRIVVVIFSNEYQSNASGLSLRILRAALMPPTRFKTA
jgi:hypothetical protein